MALDTPGLTLAWTRFGKARVKRDADEGPINTLTTSGICPMTLHTTPPDDIVVLKHREPMERRKPTHMYRAAVCVSLVGSRRTNTVTQG